MGYLVKTIFWKRENTTVEHSGKNLTIHLPSKFNTASLLFVLPILWQDQLRLIEKVQPSVIVVGHFVLLPVAFFWKFIKKYRGVKIIYDAIEQFPQNLSLYCGPFRKIVQPLLLMIENLFVKFCSGVLTVDSKNDKIEKRFKCRNRYTLTTYNVPSISDDPTMNQIDRLKTDYETHNVVVFVGSLRKQNGFLTAIEAAAIVKDEYANALFLFIGTLMEDPEKIQKIIHSNHLDNYVKLLNHMPYSKMLAHVKCARVGLALYQKEALYEDLSLGNARKIFAYMQAAIPVIGPRFLEIGRIVDIANCGVRIDTSDSKLLADTIIRLLENADHSRRLGSNGRAAFERRYNWEIESIKFKTLVRQIIS
jgi:glycosyltransferase involved in cell wall biosynthesis